MAEYINGSTDILGGSVIRYALNTTTPNQAVIRKIIAGNGISISSTGIDPGTGDVTISIDTSGTGGSGAGGGTPTAVGTVTSVNMTAPEGLFVLGAPITNAGTIALRLSSGYIIPLIDDVQKGINAYNDKIVSLSYNTSSGYITLTQLDGGSISAAITLAPFTTTNLVEGTNLYYTNTRARSALSFVTGSGAYNSSTGVITIPTNTNELTNGAGFITGNQLITLSGDVSGSGTTAITTTLATITQSTGSSFVKITLDTKGRVIGNSSVLSADIITALGYTPYDVTNPAGYQVTSEKGVANGYASLNSSGQIPSTQLPSYVDDVLEYANLSSFPGSGETGKIYVTLDTNKTYRWSGSAYIEISASPGSTDAVTEGSINLYFTNARARAAISLTTTGDSGASTYSSATGVINVPTYTLTGLGGVSTTRTLTINGIFYDLSADRTWSVGTVTGSGTTNYIPKWTSSTSLGNSLLDDDGIGVAVALAAGGYFSIRYLSAIKLALTGGTTFGSIDVPIGLDFLIRPDSIEKFKLSSTGLLKLANYGSGSVTGTATYRLAVDSVGNVIEVIDGGGTVTSVSGTGTVSGLTLTGTVTGSGSLTLGGTLTLTSGQVTTALGYTPYNATNPSGYISSESDTLTSVTGRGASTPANMTIANANPVFILKDTDNTGTGAGQMGYISFVDSSNIERAWIGYGSPSSTALSVTNGKGDVILNPSTGNAYVVSNLILHGGNYNSYAPTLTGGGASGNWNINSATSTLAANSTLWNSQAYYNSTGVTVQSVLVYDNVNAVWRPATSAQIQTWLGLGSNAYTSTAYLPLTGGTLTGALGGTSASFSSSVTATSFSGGVYPYNSILGSGADASTGTIFAGSTGGFVSSIDVAGGGATNPNTIIFKTASVERLRIASTGEGTFTNNVTINGTIIGTDQTFGGAYRTFAFGVNSNSYNRIFATTDATDGIYINAATGQGINFRVNGGGSNVLVIASTGAATFSSSVSTTFINVSQSGGQIGSFDSTNANGGYITWSTSGTTIADLGTAQQIFGTGGNDTFGINARGARALVFGTNNTERLRIASTGAATFSSSVTASSLIKSGGTSAQFLMADGSVSTNPGWITSFSETDTLASVTARGATTSTSIAINAILTVGGGADFYLRAPAASSDPGDIVFQDGSGAELHRLWSGPNTLYYRTNGGTTYLMWHSGNLTNLNQLTNGPGYITGYTETDTLASVTARGATTSTNITFSTDTYTTYGPNSTWGAYLRVGGNGRTVTGNLYASVVTTNGNLHLDAGNAMGTYLNYYGGTAGIAFGSGASSIVASVDTLGNIWKGSTIGAGTQYVYNSGTWGINITGTAAGETLATVTGRGNSTGSNILTSANMYAGIFYDYYDNGYYLDPNSSSRLYRVNSYYLSSATAVSDNHEFGIYFDSGLSTAYAIYRNGGPWDHPYPDLRIAFHTGIQIGANASYQGVRFYNDYDMATQVMSVNNSSDPLGGSNVYVNNSLQAGSSLRAPIFYDSQDTSYYLDPNSTSRLSTLVTYGYIYSNSWIQFDNYTGLYSPNNGAHLRPNYASYGPWLVSGTRNGWSGIEFESLSAGNVALMIKSNEVGTYNTSYGWQYRWTTGTMYVYKDTYGGGTAATVLDSVNYNSYSPTLTGGGASGTWGINIAGTAGSATALTSMNISQFTNNSGYITSAANWFGAVETGGTLDWNHVTNTRPGTGYTLLLGTASNGPGPGEYYHPFNIEYSSKDGTGNVTQMAISYSSPGDKIYMRGRYGGTWNGWTQFVTNSGTWGISITGNAATLGGYGPNQTGGANTIVQRDANGYIQNNYFYTSGGGAERNASGMGYFAGFSSGDYYIRSYTPAAVAAALGLGSMAYASTGSYATRQDGTRFSTNYNSILSSGFFNAESQPANAPNAYGQLIVAKGNDTGLQIAGGYSSQQLWFRGWGYGPEADGFYAWRRLLNDGADPYPANMNQYVRTTDNVTFARVDATNYGVGNAIYFGGGNNYFNWDGARINSNVGIQSASEMRAPIFYDSNDTTYYGDFASTSYLRHLSVGDVNAGNDSGWNARLNLTGSSHARLDVKSNSDGIITTMYSHAGQGVGRIGTMSNHALAIMVNGSVAGYAFNNYLQGVDSVRAPIFYDSQDTAYYLDPNSSSVLYSVNANRVQVTNDVTTSSGQGRFGGWYTGTGYTGAAVEIGQIGGIANVIGYNRNIGDYIPLSLAGTEIWVNTYIKRTAAGVGWLSGGYSSSETSGTTGAIYSIGGSYYPTSTSLNTMYGIGYTHSSQGQMPSGASSWGMYVAGAGIANIWLGADTGVVIATGSVRAPIYYDSADTGYYLDPNSESRLYQARFYNRIGIGGGVMPYLNTGSAGIWFSSTNDNPQWFVGMSGSNFRLYYSDSDKVFVDTSANLTAYGSVRAPIFYDSQDTSYYGDFNDQSRFLSLLLGNQTSPNAGSSYALQISSTLRYKIALCTNNASYFPWLVQDSWNGYDALIFHFNGIGDKFYFNRAGQMQADGDVRAPIFYDSENTAYYGDFASTSNLNVLAANSIYTGGGLSTNGGNNLLGVQSPGGASRASGGSTETGAFKITLPSGIPVYGMFKLVIHIYEYGQRGNGYEIHCGGHMYPNYMYNRFQVQYGTANTPLNVRYGNDGTNGCIWIGDTNTTWSYPQIWVSEFMMGYSNTSWTTWKSGWSISLVTSYGNSGAMDGPYTCDYGYAASAGSASTSSQVTINYNNDSNSTYQMLWGSGNSVYGTSNIYCNPSTDTIYAVGYRGSGNVGGTGEATWHPAGIYSGSTQWLYGTTYRNNAATYGQGNLYFDGNYGYGLVGLYSSYRYQAIFAMGDSYKLPADGTTPGSLYGLAWSHPNAGGEAGYLSTHGLLVMENGTTNTALANGIWTRGDVTAYSDARVKTNVVVIENPLEKIQAIRGVTFNRTDMEHDTKRHAGVIAQEVLEVLPEVVTTTSDGMHSVAYGNMAALFIEAIKEQQTQIEDLKKQIQYLVENR